MQNLRTHLQQIHGKGYKVYKGLKGSYRFDNFVLVIDHVQGDPFAAPSKVRVLVTQEVASFPEHTFHNRARAVALRDFLTRQFHKAIMRHVHGSRGSGKSGQVIIDTPGQEILERTSAFINEAQIEIRFTVGLPAQGRRIDGKQAITIFFDELPQVVKDALIYKNLDSEALSRHILTAEDAESLRSQLKTHKLVAFVADGALLPRKSGVDPDPLTCGDSVPFRSPDSLRCGITLPNQGKITGMGIPEGVTLIVGGGYHGKSTLLDALSLGIYNHIPGDGREMVVTDARAFKIRAEDRRRIAKVDICAFISNLPLKKDTRYFSTEDASGSTSQAANIIESLQIGAQVLLVDEDTSATNFMIRDKRMQKLIAGHYEPITPFINKVKQIYREKGVSTVLVMGGIGDYFAVADTVIWMREYVPEEVTARAQAIAREDPDGQPNREAKALDPFQKRVPLAAGIDPRRGKKAVDIKIRETTQIIFGKYKVDLGRVEQLVDASQLRAIAQAMVHAGAKMDKTATMKDVVEALISDVEQRGLDSLGPFKPNDYAQFRALELAAALNRLPSLQIQ